ncbi:MAG: tetrapyrrole methylase [Deltaproteobacteria bacterium]|nr:tetrapyrrole methylase [Deltaproteobacteria bacterium]
MRQGRFYKFLLLLVITVLLLPSGYSEGIEQGKFYVVGVGPSGPDLATLKAIRVIEEADALLCPEGLRKEFEKYIKDKLILCDPWEGLWYYHGKKFDELKGKEKEEWQRYRLKKREEIVKIIKEKMAQGKKIALLDHGDPCVYASCHWFIESFREDEVEIIPGLSAFNAASAALKKSMLPAYDSRFVMLTAPFSLLGPKEDDEKILENISKYPTTMVFYMGLKSIDRLVITLGKYYPKDLPIAVVYHAGYPNKEKVVKGNLDTILKKLEGEKEKWLGMIVVGRCLAGEPYRSSKKD